MILDLQEATSDMQQTKKSDSEKATVPRNSTAMSNALPQQFKNIEEAISSPNRHQFLNLKSTKETLFPQNTRRTPLESFQSILSNNDYSSEFPNGPEMYIKVEPEHTSSSNDEDLEEVDMGTNNWTEPDHDLFNVYNPTPESVRVKHSPTSGLLTDFNSKYSTFPGQGYSNFASGVRKLERQEPFNKFKLSSKSKAKRTRKVNPSQRPKTLLSKSIPRCAECSESLNSYKDLINHNTVHGRVSECPVCNKSFTTRGSFIRHSIAHMQKRSFPCPCCFASFTRKDNLKRHFNINHKNTNWKPSDSQSLEEKQSKTSVACEEIDFTDLKRNGDSGPYDQNTSNSLSSSSVFPTYTNYTPTGSGPPSLTKFDVKTSNLNSIVDNLHGKKTKLPLLRSILTSFKSTGGRKILKPLKNYVPHNTMQKEPDIEKSNPEHSQMINYMCSECNIGFSSLADMKCHIVRAHGEDTTNDQIHMLNDASKNQLNKEKEIVCTNIQNECFNDIVSNISSQVYLPLESCNKDNSETTETMANQETNNFSDHSEITDSSQKKMHVDLHQNECEIIQDQAIPCENLGNSTLLLSPSEIKQELAEIDIESWVTNHHDDMNYSDCGENNDHYLQDIKPQPMKTILRNEMNTSSMYLVPSQIPISSTIPDNRTYFSQPFENIGSCQKNGQKSKSSGAESKPKKRRITLHSEMTICRLCGMYLESGSHIVQHGTQVHRGQIDLSTCCVCYTKLSGYDSLYRHCQLHFGAMFSCQYCNSKFTRKDNLTRHIKNTHNNRGLNETL